MKEIIVTSKGELECLINSSVRKAINEQKIESDNSKNEIPFIKRGKKLYFRRSDLESWLLEGKRKSNSEILKELDK